MPVKICDINFELVKTSHKIIKGKVKGLDSGFRNFVHIVAYDNENFIWALELYSGTYSSKEFDGKLEQIESHLKNISDIEVIINFLNSFHIPFTTPFRSIQTVIDAIISILIIYDIYVKGELQNYLSPIPLEKCYASGGTTPYTSEEISLEIQWANQAEIPAYKFRANVGDEQRIYDAVGSVPQQMKLMIDFIGGTRSTGDYEEVLIKLKRYDDLGSLIWFEEPFSAFDFLNYQKLKQTICNTGICGGESLPSKQLLQLFDQMGCCDFIQLDACFNINFSQAVLTNFTSKTVIHNWSGPFGTLTNIILYNIIKPDWFEIPLIEYDFSHCFDSSAGILSIVKNPYEYFCASRPSALKKLQFFEDFDFKWKK